MFENLKKALKADTAEKLENRRYYIENGYFPTWAAESRNNPDRGLQEWLTPAKWEAYKAGTLTREKAVEIAVKRSTADLLKSQAVELDKLETAAAARDLVELVINVEWKRNRAWGNNPTAEVIVVGEGTYTGHASGCGYDKQSAAVAEALNQSPAVRKALYRLKENGLNDRPAEGRALNPFHPDPTREAPVSSNSICGYGAGYGILPYFEGGVGVSCFWSILEKCGFTVKGVASGRMFDAYTVERKVNTQIA